MPISSPPSFPGLSRDSGAAKLGSPSCKPTMLTEAFTATVNGMAGDVARWPRRQPGRLMIEGRTLKYADLHSFYFQARQIFGERLYDFACTSPAPLILDCGAHIGLASLAFKER